ncbi:MAG: LytTR family transcriptional regulator [Alphaproteobacteria bacterium]|nr:LytTR family transcriptional regulator [Alphaproteobacteria bacterium]
MRELPYIRSIPQQFPWVLGLAVVMAVTGPFGSYRATSLGIRLIYFVATGLLIWLQVLGFAALIAQVEATERWSITLRMALTGILAAIPATVEIILLHGWLVRPTPFSAALEIYPQTAFLTAVIAVVVGLFIEQRLHAAADSERARVAAIATAGAAAAAAPDFFRRIPPALGRDLIALEMEDHYLRIHTALGSDLILLRLRDALTELGPSRGRQVHRSWWVAEGAVETIDRNSRRPVLVLRNGLRVPVSKTYQEPLRQAGWLA